MTVLFCAVGLGLWFNCVSCALSTCSAEIRECVRSGSEVCGSPVLHGDHCK